MLVLCAVCVCSLLQYLLPSCARCLTSHELEPPRSSGGPGHKHSAGARCGRGGRPPSRMCAGALLWFALTPPSGVAFLSGEPVEPFGSVRLRLLTTTVSARCCDSLSFRARNRTAFPGTSLRAGQLAAMHAALRSSADVRNAASARAIAGGLQTSRAIHYGDNELKARKLTTVLIPG